MSIKVIKHDDVAGLIHELRAAEVTLKEAQARKDIIQKELLQSLVSTQHKTRTVDNAFDNTTRLRAVYIANRRFKVDEKGLAKALGAKAFGKVIEKKVSMDLLNTAVSSGELDANVVKPFVQSVEHPTVRLYVIEKREDEPLDDDTSE